MITDTMVMSTNRDAELPVKIVTPDNSKDIKAVVIIIHGMMESIDDYTEVAVNLSTDGYAVVVPEILGHGAARVQNKRGYMGADGDGYSFAVRDIKKVYNTVCREFNLPVIMVGFSLGSFLVRELLVLNLADDLLKGVILIGTGNKSSLELAIGLKLARSKVRKYGAANVTGVVDDLAMNNYNKKFKNDNSPYAWLIRDVDYRKKFQPLEYHVSPQMFHDLLGSMWLCSNSIGELDTMPLLLISGSEDPVTGNLKKLVKFFEKKGCPSVSSLSIKGYRHAVLRDGCAGEVCMGIKSWIKWLIGIKGDSFVN